MLGSPSVNGVNFDNSNSSLASPDAIVLDAVLTLRKSADAATALAAAFDSVTNPGNTSDTSDVFDVFDLSSMSAAADGDADGDAADGDADGDAAAVSYTHLTLPTNLSV